MAADIVATDIRPHLEAKNLDELRVLARTLQVSGFSALNKAALVDRILATNEPALRKILWPSWWAKNHNHFYGVVGVIAFLATLPIWSNLSRSAGPSASSSPANQTSVETPLRFIDFASMTPDKRSEVLDKYRGTQAVWEGIFSDPIDFVLQNESGFPEISLEKPIGMRIVPVRGNYAQISAECQLGVLGGGDAGYENRARLMLLAIGQRVRISGKLDGTCDVPIFKDAFLEAEWPPGE